jgi:hypothetical protein
MSKKYYFKNYIYNIFFCVLPIMTILPIAIVGCRNIGSADFYYDMKTETLISCTNNFTSLQIEIYRKTNKKQDSIRLGVFDLEPQNSDYCSLKDWRKNCKVSDSFGVIYKDSLVFPIPNATYDITNNQFGGGMQWLTLKTDSLGKVLYCTKTRCIEN